MRNTAEILLVQRQIFPLSFIYFNYNEFLLQNKKNATLELYIIQKYILVKKCGLKSYFQKSDTV